jgi:hypothetical protein
VGHASPALRPVRALLIRVPLGPRPWLHRLRHRSPGFVRRLRRYSIHRMIENPVYGGAYAYGKTAVAASHGAAGVKARRKARADWAGAYAERP